MLIKKPTVRHLIVKRLLMLYLLPIPFLLLLGYLESVSSIQNQLIGIAQQRVNNIDTFIENIHKTNQSLLAYPINCDELHQQFLFDSTIRELFYVKNGEIVCSSKRGIMDKNIKSRLHNGQMRTIELLVDLISAPEITTLLIEDAKLDNPDIGILTFVSSEYLLEKLPFHTDDRLNAVLLTIHDRTLPIDAKVTESRYTVVYASHHYGYTLTLTPSWRFVGQNLTLYLFSALLLSLVLSSMALLGFLWMRHRHDLVEELKRGLRRHELFLVYQPIVASDDGTLHGYESLIRWFNPKHGFISPEHFVKVAEKSGIITRLTEYVLEQAWEDWKNMPVKTSLHLSINLPPSYLEHSDNINNLKEFASKFATLGIQLVAEITERQLLEQQGQKVLSELRQAKVHIAIDDFGIGRTALSVLQNIEFDYLKIDKCFIDTIGIDSGSTPVLNSIIDLGHRLDVDMIAEGVETQAQAEYLKKLDVGYQQGYLHSRPMDIGSVVDQLKKTVE